MTSKTSKEDCIARIFEYRGHPLWTAVNDLLDVTIEAARDKLEKGDVDNFRKCQGRLEALRGLKKAMVRQPEE